MKSVLNTILIAESESTQNNAQNRTGIIDLQNDFYMLVTQQWTNRFSVPNVIYSAGILILYSIILNIDTLYYICIYIYYVL